MGTVADVDIGEFDLETVSGPCDRDEKNEVNGFHRYVADKLEEGGFELTETVSGSGELVGLVPSLSDIIPQFTAFFDAIPG